MSVHDLVYIVLAVSAELCPEPRLRLVLIILRELAGILRMPIT